MRDKRKHHNKIGTISFVLYSLAIIGIIVFSSVFHNSLMRKPLPNAQNRKTENPPIVALIYHHVFKGKPNGKENKMDLSANDFALQMKYLSDNHYHTADLQDIYDYLYKGKQLPPKTVLITFDDGYASNYANAFPILKQYKIHAVIFIVGNEIRHTVVTDPKRINMMDRMPLLSWSQIHEMSDSNLVEFGGHTFDAHKTNHGKSILKDMTEQQLLTDFRKEAEVFREHKLPSPLAIAYPYGQYNKTVIQSARKAGYRLGFTTQKGRIQPTTDPLRIKRITVRSSFDMEIFKTIVRIQ